MGRVAHPFALTDGHLEDVGALPFRGLCERVGCWNLDMPKGLQPVDGNFGHYFFGE